MMRYLLLAPLLGLAACTYAPTPVDASLTAAEQQRIERAGALMLRREAPAEQMRANAATCGELGGTWKQDGMLGAYHCFVPYADAGRACSDATECKGDCVAAEEGKRVGGKPGLCQADTNPFGCYGRVEQGQVNMICVD